MTDDERPADASAPGSKTAAPPAGKQRKAGSFARELPFLVAVALILALLIKAFLIQAFYIPSGSMQQTLEIRDRVLVNKVVYRFRSIHRGEVVVFNGVNNFSSTEVAPLAPPSNGLQRVLRAVSSAIGVGPPNQKDFIKRVIGLPGDRVACCSNGNVTVQPAGAAAPYELHESYLFQDDHMPFCRIGQRLNSKADPETAGTGAENCPPGSPGILVPPGRVWVLGDHRGASADSRFHLDATDPLAQYRGTVPIDKVIGRAFVVVWPVSRGKILRVPSAFNTALGTGLAAGPAVLGVAGALPLTALRRRRRSRRASAGR
ncbi:MAG: signal peptidase I [Actinomycetota bacterium]|nr:signal peptidase I [Actinomycetota bacterium]